MRVVFFVFVFLILVGSVSAMDDPIRVKTGANEEVRLFIWPPEYGPAFNLDKGFADEDGYFTSKTFFSLKEDNFTVQISVFNEDGEKSSGGRFEGMSYLLPIFIDCSSSECEISFWEINNETVDENDSIVENETLEVIDNVTENQTVVVENQAAVEEKFGQLSFVGKAIFRSEDGSINLGYSIGAIILLVIIFLSIFIMIIRKKKKTGLVDEDDKDLASMEKKLKDTEAKIKSIKDTNAKKKRLEEVKVKLISDEKVLKDLENGGEIEEVQKKIEKQEDNVKDDENSSSVEEDRH